MQNLFLRLLNRVIGPSYRIIRSQSWNRLNIDVQPKSLIDVGSANETTHLYSCFADVPILMIDPLREYELDMQSVIESRGGAIEFVALGSREGEIEINVNIDRPVRSSVFERTSLTATEHRYESRSVPLTTLDVLMKKHPEFEVPYALKIDTEGYETEVLRGASETLKDCCLVIMECSIQKRFEDSYRFEELVSLMTQHGFTVSNILSAESDENGLVRYVDLLFVPLNERGMLQV